MTPGDVFLGQFPFGNVAGMKLRPVLLVSDVVGPASEVLVASISSVLPAVMLSTDILLNPSHERNRSTNLKVTSVLRLHKLATIHKSSLVRRLGELSPEALEEEKVPATKSGQPARPADGGGPRRLPLAPTTGSQRKKRCQPPNLGKIPAILKKPTPKKVAGTFSSFPRHSAERLLA